MTDDLPKPHTLYVMGVALQAFWSTTTGPYVRGALYTIAGWPEGIALDELLGLVDPWHRAAVHIDLLQSIVHNAAWLETYQVPNRPLSPDYVRPTRAFQVAMTLFPCGGSPLTETWPDSCLRIG